jgi:hypothetical protein
MSTASSFCSSPDEPQLLAHGSFSLPVNYHALALAAAAQGGHMLFLDRKDGSFVVSASLFGEQAKPWPRTRRALVETLEGFGLGDFFLGQESPGANRGAPRPRSHDGPSSPESLGCARPGSLLAVLGRDSTRLPRRSARSGRKRWNGCWPVTCPLVRTVIWSGRSPDLRRIPGCLPQPPLVAPRFLATPSSVRHLGTRLNSVWPRSLPARPMPAAAGGPARSVARCSVRAQQPPWRSWRWRRRRGPCSRAARGAV